MSQRPEQNVKVMHAEAHRLAWNDKANDATLLVVLCETLCSATAHSRDALHKGQLCQTSHMTLT